jgi:A/G-specific adenine glycosylase
MTQLPFAPDELLTLQQSLLAWGQENYRPFPWRETSDPYHILLAEVFLHRTQARQVETVYRQVIQRYPTPADLLSANQKRIRLTLYALGLHWRTDLLLKMVQQIQQQYGGQIPCEREALLALPGVSDYIAGAVRCFAWNESEVLLDTNTVRIIGRLLGWEIKDSSRRSPRFRQALEALLDHENPRAFNYALLDLAHLVCLKKQKPLCNKCPLISMCQMGQSLRAS